MMGTLRCLTHDKLAHAKQEEVNCNSMPKPSEYAKAFPEGLSAFPNSNKESSCICRVWRLTAGRLPIKGTVTHLRRHRHGICTLLISLRKMQICQSIIMQTFGTHRLQDNVVHVSSAIPPSGPCGACVDSKQEGLLSHSKAPADRNPLRLASFLS